MSVLNVKRADDGSIAEIAKQITAADYLRFAAFTALLTAAAIYLNFSQQFAAFVHKIDLPTAVAAGVLIASFAVMLMALYRLHPGRSMLLADRDGMHFIFYAELGIVPWSAIEEFDQESSPIWTMGSDLLVAKLKNPEDWILRLKASNLFNPLTANPWRRPRAPFAMVEGSASLDLDALQNALSEMKTRAG